MTVSEAWCLYSTPKPSAVWARDASKFVEAMSDPTFQLPKALWSLTHGPGFFDNLKLPGQPRQSDNIAIRFIKAAFPSTQVTDKSERPPRPFFPLPTSHSQNRIAELLLTCNLPAVVCEGPPGKQHKHVAATVISFPLLCFFNTTLRSGYAVFCKVLARHIPLQTLSALIFVTANVFW